ncbi:hypothetical protein [Trichocoleus sp. FACHB-262]|uniref:hypothetical protein n=1 Tax=Trichocoleus sp. FACHB-262 TaxID=2692869 RepID=UPI001F54D168|nr:hypothetical protein [Trichocoleus sp. FACHB-262]
MAKRQCAIGADAALCLPEWAILSLVLQNWDALRLYLYRGFYSVPVIRWLKALQIPFPMPAVIRGKTGGTRQLLILLLLLW